MKKFSKNSILMLVGAGIYLFLSSCGNSVELAKRHYNSGYYVSVNSKAPAVVKHKDKVIKENDKPTELEISQSNNLPLSASLSTGDGIINKTETYSETGAGFSTKPEISKKEQISTFHKEVRSDDVEAKQISQGQRSTFRSNKAATALGGAKESGSGKSQLLALLLCFFLGWLGVSRFYLGYHGLAIMEFLFMVIGLPLSALLIGLPLVGVVVLLNIIDFIRILVGNLKPKHGDYSQTM